MSDGKAKAATPRPARAAPTPTTPDPIEIAMEAEASGEAPRGVAHEVLVEQRRLIRWQVANEKAGFAVRALTALAGVAGVLVVALFVWDASQDRSIVVRPFSTPPASAAKGLTGGVVAARFMDQLRQVERTAARNSFQDARQLRDVADGLRVEIPQTGLSLEDLRRWLVQRVGHGTTIEGALWVAEDGNLTLEVRVGAEPAVQITGRPGELDHLIKAAAEGAFARTEPAMLSRYLTGVGREDEALAAARAYALSLPTSNSNAVGAFALWALSEGDWEKSLELFHKASRADGLVIEAFSVPPALAERGITGETVARQLMDGLAAISEVSRSTEQQRGLSGDWGQSISIQIPQTGVSLAQINAWLRDTLGHQSHVSGEVMAAPDGALTLVARSGSHGLTPLTGREVEMAALIHRTAEAVYAREQIRSYPIYLTRYDRWDELGAWAQTRLSSPVAWDRARGYFWLSLVAQRNQGDLARRALLQKSAAADPTYPSASSHLSYLEIGFGHPEAAQRLRQKHLRLIAVDTATSAESMRQQTATSRRVVAELDGDWIEARSQARANLGRVVLGGGGEPTSLALARLNAALHDLRQAQVDLDGFEPVTPEDQQVIRSATLEIRIRAEDWPGVVKAADAVLADQERMPDKGALRPIPRAQKAVALAHLGRMVEAQALVGATPLDCQPCVIARGEIAALAGQPQLADHWFGEALKMAPSLPMASTAWGRVLLDRGQPDRAIAQFEIANTQGPRFADPLSWWGEALLRKGETKAAIRKFKEADKYAPKWGRNHLLWGDALAKLGKVDKAREHWREAAGIDLSAADRARVSQLLARPA